MNPLLQMLRSAALWSPFQLVLLGLTVGLAFAALGAKASPMIALAAIIGLFGGFVLIRYPVLGLYATAILVPVERLGRFTDDTTEFTVSLMRIVGIAALGAMLVNRVLTRQGVHFGTPFWLYAAFVAFGIATLGWTEDFTGTVRASSALVGNLMFFFLIVNLTRTPQQGMIAVLLWLAATLGTVAYSTYDWHFGSGVDGGVQTDFDPGAGAQSAENRFSTVWNDRAEFEALSGVSARRSMGPTSHAAVYGINLIMTIPFFLLLLRYPLSLLFKFGVLVTLVGVLYNTLLTNTRAVILMAGLTGLLCMWRGLFPMRREYLIVGLLALPLVLAVVPEDIWNRILDLSNYTLERSASLRIRIEYVSAALQAISDRFLFGWGIGNQAVIPLYLPPDLLAPEKTTTHNIYLQMLLETGLVGSTVFFSFVLVLLRMAFVTAAAHRGKPGREQEYWFMVASQITMISVLIFGLQVDVFQFPLKGWWLIAGITYVMYRQLPQYERVPTGNPDAPPAAPAPRAAPGAALPGPIRGGALGS